ncbi:MAG: PadR family transcriptional regulator [Ardenticatenaceae bacterium]|nr:PadR family transcriptional regulator [Ardenticatenaceae bacterium]
MKMKLEHYILGLLTINPSTGYDIKKHLDTEGRFARRRAPLSQIYTTLKRMLENGLVTFEEERRDGKPDLKIYSFTAQGEQFLIDFLHSPIEYSFRYTESSVLFRIKHAYLVDTAVIIGQIRDELHFRQEQIHKFRHRDRTIHSHILSTPDLAYAQAIEDKLHGYGADRMDVFVSHLEKMAAFFEEHQEAAKAETAVATTNAPQR